MSHIVTCKVALTKPALLKKAIAHCGLVDLGVKRHKVYSETVEGQGVSLPDWHHPVVIKADGTAVYDNFNGSWGKQVELDKLVQRYAIEALTEEAAINNGMVMMENRLENGDVEMHIELMATS